MDRNIFNDRSLTVRQKGLLLHVSPQTVVNKLAGRHLMKRGRPLKFTENEEQNVVDLILRCHEFGVPVNKSILQRHLLPSLV